MWLYTRYVCIYISQKLHSMPYSSFCSERRYILAELYLHINSEFLCTYNSANVYKFLYIHRIFHIFLRIYIQFCEHIDTQRHTKGNGKFGNQNS